VDLGTSTDSRCLGTGVSGGCLECIRYFGHMTTPKPTPAIATSAGDGDRHLRIDAHHHLWDLTVRPQPWTEDFPKLRRTFTFAELLPQLDAAGIDGTVLVQTVGDPGETPEMLELAAREPRIFGVVGWVDLQAEDVEDRLGELLAGPGGDYLVAIRHGVQEEPDPGFLARPAFRRGLAVLSALGLGYDMLVRPSQLPAVIDTVTAIPELRVILDHCAKPNLHEGISPQWFRDIDLLAQHPSVAVKLSGLVTEARPDWTFDDLRPASDAVLRAFGPERVMIGSDWPACLPAAEYAEVMDAAQALISAAWPAGVPGDVRANLEGGTAIAWYRLGEKHRLPVSQ
jgi:L-fuconolactonase